ncbi:hypothetical protein MRX96_007181 [Rhipicephalus microplus]
MNFYFFVQIALMRIALMRVDSVVGLVEVFHRKKTLSRLRRTAPSTENLHGKQRLKCPSPTMWSTEILQRTPLSFSIKPGAIFSSLSVGLTAPCSGGCS